MPAQDYLDFELNIEALAENKVRVTVVNSPVGSVSVETTNPFTAEEVARVIGVLDGSTRVTRGEATRVARAFGERLFSAVFSGPVYAAYLTSRNQAGERGLRVKLGLEHAKHLEDLPWELLRDPTGDYLVLSRQTPLIRYPRLLTVRPLVEVSLPLRVLVLISSPRDQEQLDVEGEWRALQEATAELRNRGLLELERVDNAQLTTLQRKLREGTSFQVFHYIGHAAFDERSQMGMLAFEDSRTEETVPVSGEALARELSEENSIRLVVLNACHGARKNQQDPYAGIASSIVARGVPAVVAMQFAISDQASRIFAMEFYRALSEGYPIEASLAEARRAISSSLNNLEWATPVLYLRAPTGVLFPKRRSHAARASRGGLREAVLRLPVLLSVVAVVAVVSLLIVMVRGGLILTDEGTPVPQIATLTPTPTGAPRDIDLAVASVRFLPPEPAPGEPVVIAVRIENRGTSDSGPFRWAWFSANPQENQIPTLQGGVVNLSGGLNTTLISNFRFPWWGTYNSTTWVNFDNQAPEMNIFNNLLSRTITTSNGPFDIDFTRLPDGTLLEPRDLDGDEYLPWGFRMSADGAGVDGCAQATVRLEFSADDLNQIVTALPGSPAACRGLPLTFTLIPPVSTPQIGRFSLNFMPMTAGLYTLALLGADGSPVATDALEIEAASVNTVQRLTLAGPEGAFNRARVVFNVPEGGATIIRQLRFELPQ